MNLQLIFYILTLLFTDLTFSKIISNSCSYSKNDTKCVVSSILLNNSNFEYKYKINKSKKVKILEIKDSQIHKLSRKFCDKFSSLETFTTFRTHINLIEKNAFQSCKNLLVLRLGATNISPELDDSLFEANIKLQAINLQENELTSINPRMFDGLFNLKNISLHSNNLTEVDFGNFSILPKIDSLYLHGNPLWYLDVSAIVEKFPNLTYLTVFGKSLLINGRNSQLSCENSQNLREILASCDIYTDFDNQTCLKFDDWYQKCENDKICSGILKKIVKNKVSQDNVTCEHTYEGYEDHYTEKVLTLENYDKVNVGSYDTTALILVAVINFFIGIGVIKCFTNKKLKTTVFKWTENTMYHSRVQSSNSNNTNDEEQLSINNRETSTKQMILRNENTRTITSNDKYPQTFDLDSDQKVISAEKIGEGTFGRVHRGKLIKNNNEYPVAVKYICPFKNNSEAQITFEISTMQNLIHANIVRFLGYKSYNQFHIIVMEYMAKGSLPEYLNSFCAKEFNGNPKHLLQLSKDIANGLEYLFKENIVHCDLAARNILITGENHAKISDFGLARFCNSNGYYTSHSKKPQPLKWYAPEAIESGKYTKMSDIWSFGVTLYEMFSLGKKPYDNILHITAEHIKTNVLEKPELCPKEIYEKLLLPCWKLEPNERPTIDQIINTIDEISLLNLDPISMTGHYV